MPSPHIIEQTNPLRSSRTVSPPVGSASPPVPKMAEPETTSCWDGTCRKHFNKSVITNLISSIFFIGGILARTFSPESHWAMIIWNIGLFSLSGGLTNQLAVVMIFDRIPGLTGSGVLLVKFREIRLSIQNMIMQTFFDMSFLEKFLSRKMSQIGAQLKIQEVIKTVLDSDTVQEMIDSKLKDLASRPEGVVLTMMGLKSPELKRVIQATLVGVACDIPAKMSGEFNIFKYIPMTTVRHELSALISNKLSELTPEMVRDILEEVIRDHLGWLVVWGALFGGILGIAGYGLEYGLQKLGSF
ncbi:hypothetical protein ADUPG1_013499 [Aduncisulcus paluster]|uniref:DUF445 domain-containing protein n=1 Tax=Aduncisulcus paluster TaxID=2918883 RepID=A0ABQ5K370_9EUKA|nr:hypothetical protein ADUPG1_013499 [Aduncisulcus paluster]|eukprot:gnl/Carplike_NY0171/3066_a4121_570.p1 GENE.gnl/Carplike_NY0171/3066_a4121_570~~gnl/Carplike_NY0171/3066_a4121_570.p1  ORF type:complete len:300 (-),score=62.16 gnl/Carplike_NY0171/3066_a4121_570:517-1416(-)